MFAHILDDFQIMLSHNVLLNNSFGTGLRYHRITWNNLQSIYQLNEIEISCSEIFWLVNTRKTQIHKNVSNIQIKWVNKSNETENGFLYGMINDRGSLFSVLSMTKASTVSHINAEKPV